MSQHGHGGNQPGNYEKTDVKPSLIWISLFVLGIFIAAGIFLSLASYKGLQFFLKTRDKALPPMMETNVQPPEPRLQVFPAQDLEKFQSEQQAALNAYAWVNQETGIARIPVARAMEILAKRPQAPKQEAAV